MKAETTIEFSQADVLDALLERAQQKYGMFKNLPMFTIIVGGKEIGDKQIEARLRLTDANEGGANEGGVGGAPK